MCLAVPLRYVNSTFLGNAELTQWALPISIITLRFLIDQIVSTCLRGGYWLEWEGEDMQHLHVVLTNSVAAGIVEGIHMYL
jgi:hypothetical protein